MVHFKLRLNANVLLVSQMTKLFTAHYPCNPSSSGKPVIYKVIAPHLVHPSLTSLILPPALDFQSPMFSLNELNSIANSDLLLQVTVPNDTNCQKLRRFLICLNSTIVIFLMVCLFGI